MSDADTRADDLDRRLIDAATGSAMPPHVYFHVPFCASKCDYCDFYSVPSAAPDTVEAVFSGMRAEVHQWANACLPGVVETLYVGGGTPSLFPAQVGRLIDWARRRLPVRDGAEITVEANPDSLSGKALDVLASAGATRISVGAQSFDDSVLAILGRRHSAEQALEACERVRSAGLDLAIDLMCGCPAQTSQPHVAWQRSLYHLLEVDPVHVSVYPLQIEESTPLAAAVAAGTVAVPDEDEVADELEEAARWLAAAGLERYEVANYAIPGHESRHNTAYWTGASYLGVGPGSHGMLDRATALASGYADTLSSAPGHRWRYRAPDSIEAWLTGEEPDAEVLSEAEAAREDVMLGLRLVRGVSCAQVDVAGLTAALESLAGDGLVEFIGMRAQGRWRVTPRGWLLGNEVFGRVWSVDD